MLSAGVLIAIETVSSYNFKHIMSFDQYESIQPWHGVPYPSVTICAVQLRDRWNLQKALLNDVDMLDGSGRLRIESLGNYRMVFEDLVNKQWIQNNAIEHLSGRWTRPSCVQLRFFLGNVLSSMRFPSGDGAPSHFKPG